MSKKLDLYLMLVLRRRFEAVIREMSATLLRSGRSGVLNTAKDFSCCITDADMQTLSSAQGIPIHVGCIHLIPAAVKEKFGDDIRPGDCFVNNSGYMGNTHCADFTLCVPVFIGGHILFYAIARAHLADMGFPSPTTYSPESRDYYEEGLMLPCVRIQSDFADIAGVVDICKANIRGPEQFYGDYQAVLAAVRTGEKRLTQIVGEFSEDVIKEFLEDYQAYAESMMDAAVKGLPSGTFRGEARYDSDLPEYPNGIPVTASLEIDGVNGFVTVDLMDNVDNLPLGINMTEATVTSACYGGVLSMLSKDVPRCAGAYRRIRINMREGAALGKPRFPASTAAATTNLTHILMSLVQSLFASISPQMGAAFSSIGQPASAPCVSGTDSRHGGRPFFNQVILGYWCGPAVAGHDGWFTFASASSQGTIMQSSVEVVEQQQPILIEKLEIRRDSGGAGRWAGGPGSECVIRARSDAVRYMVTSAGRAFPPLGVRGGRSGGGNEAWLISRDGRKTHLPIALDIVLRPGEVIVSHSCGGGGYGDPRLREPERVLGDVRDGRISTQAALEHYAVAIDAQGGTFEIDMAKTGQLRAKAHTQMN